MVMDVIRTCYNTTMRFRLGDPPIPVRWYRAAPDALVFPGEHSCFSFDTEDEKTNDLLGEQRPPRGTWDAGMRPAALSGDGHIQGDFRSFSEGLESFASFAQGETCAIEPEDCACGLGPFDAPPSAEGGQTEWHLTCGGLRWSQIAGGIPSPCQVCVSLPDFPDDPLVGVCMPDQLRATFSPIIGYSCFLGLVVRLQRVGMDPCIWSGQATVMCPGPIVLGFDFSNALRPPTGDWVINWSFGASGQDTQDAATVSPLSVTFLNCTGVPGAPGDVVQCVISRP